MFVVDNGIQDLMSASSHYFLSLIENYQFKLDSPDFADRTDDNKMLCLINQQVAKNLGLKELALTWKSLAKIANEIKIQRVLDNQVKQ